MYLFFRSEDRDAFVIIRASFKATAKNKIQQLTDGHGLLKWTMFKMDEEDKKKLLDKYELNTVYELDDA